MGQNKLENEFRKKLNAREIAPNSNAWDRLDAMLTVGEEKKTQRSYKWLYIAASFLGFLLIATMFFNSGKETTIVQSVVEEQNVGKASVKEENEKVKAIVPENQTEIAGIEDPKPTAKAPKATQKVNHQKIILQENLASANEHIQKSSNHSIINQNEQLTNPEKTNAKVDELLASANEDQKPAIPKKPTLKVDASSLLSQVDGELELSFREKVINTVGKNYKNVKVALANRNNQE